MYSCSGAVAFEAAVEGGGDSSVAVVGADVGPVDPAVFVLISIIDAVGDF